MPYSGETANKSTHATIAGDPALRAFLQSCQFVTPPSAAVAQGISAQFFSPPAPALDWLPLDAVAVDGSSYYSVIDTQPPVTRIGTIKVGTSRLSHSEYEALRQDGLADLFKLASVEQGYSSTSFSLAGDNVSVGGLPTHLESFRYSVNEALAKDVPGGDSLMDTLFILANMRPWPLGTNNNSLIMVDECPECGQGNILIHRRSCQDPCPRCGSTIYAADVLKLWKEDGDDDFEATGNRVMSVCEHLMLVRNVHQMSKDNPQALGHTAFIVDGPLAVSGLWTQWFHRCWQPAKVGHFRK